jgi:hypothetical protein
MRHLNHRLKVAEEVARSYNKLCSIARAASFGIASLTKRHGLGAAATQTVDLAWVRTGIAVIAFGFVIEKIQSFCACDGKLHLL